MSDPEKPLTEYALSRLRRLAEGNGIDPQKIKLNSAEEKMIALAGVMILKPTAEVKNQRLMGAGLKLPKAERTFNSFAELSSCVAEEQQDFAESSDWFEEVKADLDKLPGKGWGLENARIILDSKPEKHFSAAETCTVCFGARSLTCDYCAGKGYLPCRVCFERGVEPCYFCFSSGRNPQNPELPCPTCNGTRFAICRTCQGRKGLPCGNCHANGTLVCTGCAGGGQIIELATVSYGAEASFTVGSSAEMPSAVRRALDKAGGLQLLTKGHAVIDYKVPDADDQRPGMMALHYTAAFPTADLIVQFDTRPRRIAVFGNKRVMLEVPPYLDQSLDKAIKKLRNAAAGKGGLDKLRRYTALGQACQLILEGHGQANDLRRLYPIGMTRETAATIMKLMRAALARQTMVARWAGFIAAFVLADVLGGALYLTPVHKNIVLTGGETLGLAVEILLPLLCAVMGYLLTGQAALLHLRRAFPGAKLAARHHGGMLALAAAAVAFLVPFGISAIKPAGVLWLRFLGF